MRMDAIKQYAQGLSVRGLALRFALYSLAVLFFYISIGCGSVPKTRSVASDGFERKGLFQALESAESGDYWYSERPSGRLGVPHNAGFSRAGFGWPVRSGSVSSYYGPRSRNFHEGIDIGAPRGAPVLAAKAGRVVYSGRAIRGYGNLVIISHNSGYSTLYAHNSRNLVRKGSYVRRGEKIALIGSTGRSTGPHVHFEVRKNERPADPLGYLPGVAARYTRGLASRNAGSM